MSNVKTKDIDFNGRYAKTELFGTYDDFECIVNNLKVLYEYIDKKEKGDSIFKYGKAYRKILRIARAYAGVRSHIISKRQVANLIKVHIDEDGEGYVKIPYAADYIFRAIFAILDEYKESSDDIPEAIVKMYGKSRRECFYKEQSFSYAKTCRNDDERLKINLNLDLNSEKCSLGGRV